MTNWRECGFVPSSDGEESDTELSTQNTDQGEYELPQPESRQTIEPKNIISKINNKRKPTVLTKTSSQQSTSEEPTKRLCIDNERPAATTTSTSSSIAATSDEQYVYHTFKNCPRCRNSTDYESEKFAHLYWIFMRLPDEDFRELNPWTRSPGEAEYIEMLESCIELEVATYESVKADLEKRMERCIRLRL